jgi:hypothetical protein
MCGGYACDATGFQQELLMSISQIELLISRLLLIDRRIIGIYDISEIPKAFEYYHFICADQASFVTLAVTLS